MRKAILSCTLILFLQACSSQLVSKEEEKQLLTFPVEPAETGFFINHFEIAEIIPIQTSEEFLISDIKRVIRHLDKIILLSGENNTVFVINANNGKIETSINNVGKGPGEWKMILDIAFDKESEELLIYNDYGKLLSFDLRGRFLSEYEVNNLYENIHVDGSNILFFNKLDGYACYPYLIDVLNRTDKKWRTIGHNEKVNFPIRGSGRQLVNSKQLWFTAPLDFNLFLYEDGHILEPYEVAIANTHLSQDLLDKATSNPMQFFGEVAKNDLIYSINSIRETSDFIIFRTNRGGLFSINKVNGEIHWDEFVNESSLNMNLNYYPHDGDDDKIMFILPAESYTKNAKKIKTMQDVGELDNPILIFYKQKDS